MGSGRAQALHKLPTGIRGFDELSHGGLPRHRTSLLVGGPGAGKTVFALQCLVNAARRQRAITVIMLCSALVAAAIGFSAGFSAWLSLILLTCYAFTVPADSGALTSGVTAAADVNFRGATLALHSMVGFGLSALGGWAVGVAIDAAGGPQSSQGWMAAFFVMGAAILLGPLALWWSRRPTADSNRRRTD